MKVTISDGRKRTLSQNALMHKWFGEISDYLIMVGHVRMECGYKVTPKSVKDKLKGMFLPTVTDSYYCPLSKRMVEFVRPKSTRDLTVSEKYNF